MTLFDLVFLASFLTAACTLVVGLVAMVRGHRTRARLLVRRVGVGVAIYFAIVLAVSAFTPQRYLRRGDLECSDDWCISVTTIRRARSGGVDLYDVTFQLICRARRVAQRERFVTAYLLDDRGRRYFPLPDPKSVPFDTLLQAGEAVTAVREFQLPGDAHAVGVVVSRSAPGRFPGCCIIGDENSFFHRRSIIRLD